MSAETPSLSDLAQAALAVVGKRGGPGVHAAVLDGIQFAITLDGPDLPDAIPEKFAPPKMVRESMDWTGTYTLKVAAPCIVLEIAWNPGEPFRLMGFSRGSWENALTRLAAS